jgi:hypothetical protein
VSATCTVIPTNISVAQREWTQRTPLDKRQQTPRIKFCRGACLCRLEGLVTSGGLSTWPATQRIRRPYGCFLSSSPSRPRNN